MIHSFTLGKTVELAACLLKPMDNKNIAKLMLKFLLIFSVLTITCASPRAGLEVMKLMADNSLMKSKPDAKERRKFCNAFYYLKRSGYINIEYRGRQMHISLTETGKRKAGIYKINDLKIQKPKKWDGNWRMLIFDIEDKQKMKREALRGKLKELNMFQLQKSVWVYPYNFRKEIVLLRDFFGLTPDEMKIIEAKSIENDGAVRHYFGL